MDSHGKAVKAYDRTGVVEELLLGFVQLRRSFAVGVSFLFRRRVSDKPAQQVVDWRLTLPVLEDFLNLWE